jgi:hypothetical protein
VHDEVGDTVPTQKQIDQLRSNAKLAAKAGAKLAADMGPGTYSVYLDGNRIDVPVSEETTAKEIATALNEKAGYDFASVAPAAKAFRGQITEFSINGKTCKVEAADDLVDADMSSPDTEWKAAKNAILTKKKAYADTPTGTVEWDEEKGEALRKKVEWLENKRCFGLIKPFRDALHLVLWDDGDFIGMDIACPVCGACDSSHDCLFRAQHVSELFDERHKSDESTINEMKDCKCDSCHHHLKYDFKNETVTIRRGESQKP